MSSGFATLASPRASSRSAAASRRESAGNSRPAASQASAQRIPSPPALVSDADAMAARQRLRREQRRRVEELLERVGADHACLVEERVDRRVRAGECRRVRARRARAGRVAPALQREDRLRRATRRASARELPRVAERLEVEQDDVGLSGRPPSTRAGRSTRRRPCCRSRRTTRARGRARPPARAARARARRSAREADVPGRDRCARERRVQPDGRRGDPQAVRPEQPRPVRAHEREQLVLALRALAARLGEAGRDHAQRAHAGAERVLGRGEHVLAGEADDARSTGVGNLGDRGVGRTPPTGSRPRLTGYAAPGIRLRMLRKSSPPIVPRRARRRRRRPDGGWKNGAARRRPRHGRAGRPRSMYGAVEAIGKMTSNDPAVDLAVDVEARVREDVEHRGLPGNTSATKRRSRLAATRRAARADACRARGPAARRRRRKRPPPSADRETRPVRRGRRSSPRPSPISAPRSTKSGSTKRSASHRPPRRFRESGCRGSAARAHGRRR